MPIALRPRALVTGLAVAGLSLSLAACGGSPQAGIANLGKGKTSTTIQSSAPAATDGSGGAGLSSNSGGGGPGGGGPGGGLSGTMSVGSYSDMVKFARCMRSHGVSNFPDPSGNGSVSFGSGNGIDPQSSQFQAADLACRALLPRGGKPSPAQQAKAVAQALKFSQCMQAHGIRDFPDPKVQAGGGIAIRIKSSPGSDMDPNNPRFQAAQNACQNIMPGPKQVGR